jgi:YD repeat-containing protein
LEYDLNGNLARWADLSCEWDFRNRLVRVEKEGAIARYTYDHSGRRVLKHVERAASATAQSPSFTVYVNQYFEIRERGESVKHIWNGPIRIARVIGSLSDRDLVQRVRLAAGWNLLTVEGRVEQVELPAEAVSAHVWDSATSTWRPVSNGDPIDAGAVLWVKVSAPARLRLPGVRVALQDPSLPAV